MSDPADNARALMTKDARNRLRFKQRDLAEAVADALTSDAKADVLIRRAEKSIGTYTAKVLCDHRSIVSNTFRSNGATVFAYACTDCKTRITSRTRL